MARAQQREHLVLLGREVQVVGARRRRAALRRAAARRREALGLEHGERVSHGARAERREDRARGRPQAAAATQRTHKCTYKRVQI